MALDFGNLRTLEELGSWYEQARKELSACMSSPQDNENLERVKYLEMQLRFSSIYASRFPSFFSRIRVWRTKRLLRRAADYLIQSRRPEYSCLVSRRDTVGEFGEGVRIGKMPISMSQPLIQRLFA